MKSSIDPITLEIINESLVSIVREMRANMVRTAYSSIIYEGHDFSCVLVDGKGHLVSMAEDNPIHIFPVPMEVEQMLVNYKGDIRPGDIFLHNDPYSGGTHLNDIALISPLFYDNKMVVFPVVRAHWADVGGTNPGSISGKNTEIHHDGLRIPITRIARNNKVNEEIIDFLVSNMRLSDDRKGDFYAMLATCNTGHKRLIELGKKYGWKLISKTVETLLRNSELSMKKRIQELPQGEYHFEHFMDHTGQNLKPVRIRASAKKIKDKLFIDFDGTDMQSESAYNVGPSMAPSAAFTIIKAFLDPKSPINHGVFRVLNIEIEKGTLLSANYPASCAGSMEVTHAVFSTVMPIIGGFVDASITGDNKGTSNHIYIGGINSKSGEEFLFYEFPAGGTGAFLESDGNNAVRNFMEGDFGSIQSVEVIENLYPLQVKKLALEKDSGGAGFRRGGLGIRREIEVLSEDAILSISSDKNIIPPYGVLKGKSGYPNKFKVMRKNKLLEPSSTPGKVGGFALMKNDIVVICSAGGGGYGDPLKRDPEKVLHDVNSGYVSKGSAKSMYGLVFKDNLVDSRSTQLTRKAMREKRLFLKLSLIDRNEEDSKRICYLHPETVRKYALQEDMLLELYGKSLAPLRAWIKIDSRISENDLCIDSIGAKILGLKINEKIFISPLNA